MHTSLTSPAAKSEEQVGERKCATLGFGMPIKRGLTAPAQSIKQALKRGYRGRRNKSRHEEEEEEEEGEEADMTRWQGVGWKRALMHAPY